MTQEEKQLLLKDLCARLLYEVILLSSNNKITYQTDGNTAAELLIEEGWKPYLRSMSSMTEEEKKEYEKCYQSDDTTTATLLIDFYNKKHFDYRGLIKMNLAIEAPEGIYN